MYAAVDSREVCIYSLKIKDSFIVNFNSFLFKSNLVINFFWEDELRKKTL